MPATLNSFLDSEIRIRYREPFLTEGLNAKAAVVVPPGIYRGFRLSTHASALTVTVTPSASPNTDHVAVFQTSAGRSITIRRTASFSLDLTAYANKTVVIAIHGSYILGGTTYMNVLCYELDPSDEYTIASELNQLIVLGTVFVPPAGVIDASEITHSRRTMAWEKRAPESISWVPALRNGGFEIADVGATYRQSIRFWQLVNDTGGTLTTATTDPRSGITHLQFTYTAGSAVTACKQYVNVPVQEGQLVRVQLYVKALKALTGGTIELRLYWMNSTGTAFLSELLDIPATGVDASYRKVEATYAAPAGAVFAGLVNLNLVSATFGSAGVAVRFDDLQVFVESRDSAEMFAGDDKARQLESLEDLVFETAGATFAASAAAVLLRTASTGTLVGSRKDEDAASASQPTLNWKGKATLGENLLDTDAKAIVARLTMADYGAGSSDRTLIFEWPSSTAGRPHVRLYKRWDDLLEFTFNAIWDNGTNLWTIEADAAAHASTKIQMNKDQLFVGRRNAGAGTWADDATGWDIGHPTLGLLWADQGPSSSAAHTNMVTPSSIVKSWGTLDTDGVGGIALVDGFNSDATPTLAVTLITVDFPAVMANDDYYLQVWIANPPGAAGALPLTTQTVTGFTVFFSEDANGPAIDLSAVAKRVYYVVIGRQDT